ncbi:hypoxia induced protein conserved region [Necator americanus]|uniref:Hypoxia induced protein conserved region n=1 Tax=Necator americanus TaxID=51031 RepID=W2TTC9_NECAM|nr:hypoxia induced protein conserved region [Necator americanus]ETN84302.1 hypoxia induced protein conserved region [Necator americanus]
MKALPVTRKAIEEESRKDENVLQIPAIPTDIGFSSGKDTGGKKKSGVVSQATSNPVVIIGMGLTTLALLGMFRSSFVGDKLGAQKYMQYRIMAQFFTVTALVAGVTFFGATYEDEDVKARENVPSPTAMLHKH